MSSSFRAKASVSQPRYAALRALLAESKRRGKPKAKAMRKKKIMSLSKLAKKGKKRGLKKQALEKAMSKHELPPLPPPVRRMSRMSQPLLRVKCHLRALGEWSMRIGESKIPTMRQLFLLAASSSPTVASTLLT